MQKKSKLSWLFLSLMLVLIGHFSGCTKKADSRPNFIFKPAPNQTDAFKIGDKTFTHAELIKDIESDLFEAEMKVHEIKMNKLKSMAIEHFIAGDTRKGTMTNDEFLEKYIAKTVSLSDKEVMDFIVSRNIPADQVNDQIKERARKFLEMEKKKESIEVWLAEQTKKSSIEIYFSRPLRPVFDVQVGDAPFVGAADAKVTVVEFSDFQCPFCAKGREVLDEIKKRYGDKVRIAFKNYPLPFHNQARAAANAALCAKEQDPKAFWKLHDIMFGDQSKLAKENLLAHGKSIGLKEDQFRNCLDSQKFAAKIDQDIAEGGKVGVKSTPTFFVNGQMINGAMPIEVFTEIIDEELAK